jgi:hypothetical protein
MKWAALITWVVTAGGGFVLLSIWLARGGMQQQREAGNRIIADKDVLAWIAFAVLLVVALLGFTMFSIWLRRRQGRATAGDAVTASTPAEQHFPVAIVGLHGVLAATTLVLVLLTAIGVGGS